MKPSSIFAALAVFCFAFAVPARSQNPEIKFIADTLVVQADGTYQADPDLATLTFDITAQDKELKPTYDRASQCLQKILTLAEKNGIARGAPAPIPQPEKITVSVMVQCAFQIQ